MIFSESSGVAKRVLAEPFVLGQREHMRPRMAFGPRLAYLAAWT